MLLLQTDNVCLTKRVTMLFDFDADESKASYFPRSLTSLETSKFVLSNEDRDAHFPVFQFPVGKREI